MSIDEIIRSVAQLQLSSHQLSQMIAMSSNDLSKQAVRLQALTKGSRTGEAASRQVMAASKSLSDSTSSLIALNNAIDNFIQEVSQ